MRACARVFVHTCVVCAIHMYPGSAHAAVPDMVTAPGAHSAAVVASCTRIHVRAVRTCKFLDGMCGSRECVMQHGSRVEPAALSGSSRSNTVGAAAPSSSALTGSATTGVPPILVGGGDQVGRVRQSHAGDRRAIDEGQARPAGVEQHVVGRTGRLGGVPVRRRRPEAARRRNPGQCRHGQHSVSGRASGYSWGFTGEA